MSRIDGKIGTEGNGPVDAAEILAALARDREATDEQRQGAVSCYLSASKGWREASTVLGGAFAAPERRLKAEKEE